MEKYRSSPLFDKIRAANAAAEKDFPGLEFRCLEKLDAAARIQKRGEIRRGWKWTLAQLAETLAERHDGCRLCPETTFSVPLSLGFPLGGSILFETDKGGEAEAVTAINNIIFRLLSTTPPGKVSFTIFDPVGLGQNFAALMHLADYEESHINSRIWTQTAQFEEKLAELNEHMEKVIQMYLRNEYATIAEYNAQAGSIAEKYHFLVIASFPVNFSEVAARRLRNIAANGARCGVYTLIHWDQRNAPPNDFVPDELRKNSVRLVARRKRISGWPTGATPGTPAAARPAAAAGIGDAFPPRSRRERQGFHARRSAVCSRSRRRTPKSGRRTPPRNCACRLAAPARPNFSISPSARARASTRSIAGKTGSGKSTLFHVIITNLALWCSPEQVEFYLVDFKKGVEFKCYANRRLPHAKVVAIESDRAFGLSVLQRVDEELRRRGDLFRQAWRAGRGRLQAGRRQGTDAAVAADD